MTEHNLTGQKVNPWLTAAQNITPIPAPQAPATVVVRELPVFVAAHGGAGATSWAHLLGGIDGGLVTDTTTGSSAHGTGMVLVARASIDGVDAAKTAIAIHGYDRFACALLIPSSPSRMPRLIADEVKVLSGAVAIIFAPWTPSLLVHRATQLEPSHLGVKELNKIITSLRNIGVTFEGETP